MYKSGHLGVKRTCFLTTMHRRACRRKAGRGRKLYTGWFQRAGERTGEVWGRARAVAIVAMDGGLAAAPSYRTLGAD